MKKSTASIKKKTTAEDTTEQKGKKGSTKKEAPTKKDNVKERAQIKKHGKEQLVVKKEGWLFWLFSIVFHAACLALSCATLEISNRRASFAYNSTVVSYWATWAQTLTFGLGLICNLVPKLFLPNFIQSRGWLHELFLRTATSFSIATLVVFVVQFFMGVDQFENNILWVVLAVNVLSPIHVILENILLNHAALELYCSSLFLDAGFLICTGTMYITRMVYRHAEYDREYPYPILNTLDPLEVSAVCSIGLSLTWLVSLLFNQNCPRFYRPGPAAKVKKA
ncbi:hypothetical protein Pelo_1666 [Pelomyxa schiedti]|nr:hypothetical protein Pelo_1666 [Pelomyxa schiedti]